MDGLPGPMYLQNRVQIHSSWTQAGMRHGRTALPAAQAVSNFAQGPSKASQNYLYTSQGHFEGRRLLVTGNKRASLNTQNVRLPLSLCSRQPAVWRPKCKASAVSTQADCSPSVCLMCFQEELFPDLQGNTSALRWQSKGIC